jgi:hypothetical protein
MNEIALPDAHDRKSCVSDRALLPDAQDAQMRSFVLDEQHIKTLKPRAVEK